MSVIELRNVSFVREGRHILDDVSFAVEAGEHWALLGPNGAGKSTILGFCGALAHPTTGTVHVLDGQLGRTELQALRRSIGHVNPRHPLRSPLTVLEVVLTGVTGTIESAMRWEPTSTDLEHARSLIDTLGLTAITDARWPTLSQGERGRALIARALVSEPKLLLLDEPSTGLDVAAREQLLETIDTLEESHPEVASILVTHHLEELPSTTTHAMLVSHGRLTAVGPVRDVVTTESVTAAFEHPIDVEFRDGRWGARARRATRAR